MNYHLNHRRREDQGHGVDDWLMTYADMITLLLCFFAVFLSVSIPKKERFEKAREEVIHQFGMPEIPSLGPNTPHDVPKGIKSDEDIPYDSLPSIVDHYNDPGQVNIKKEGDVKKEDGDRIKTVELDSAPFFASGSATLSDEGKTILQNVLKDLQLDLYKDYVITVEGHTDDVPINTLQFPSNWELSTGRASAVVRFFLEQGIPAQKLRASGYADVFPKVPNRDAAGNPIPENQAQNRRVIIKLEKIEKEDGAE
jgi:chemotaxis protein MotB